ncbi:nuclear transport factor 2 family protein [Streptomyces sp. NPDC096311]|uniref:nuclear transport factor 2 family protein n=1 Tax=Streptomyces sp. NPDC096311 TaxID=3366083 RepID=UPI0038148BD9
MTYDLEQHKRVVKEFVELAFNEGEPQRAVDLYVGSRYVQHYPGERDGVEAFVEFVGKQVADGQQVHHDIRRLIAEEDMVAAHSLVTRSPDDLGIAVADYFRLEDNRIVEHWAVFQPVPESAANDNGMV